MIYPSSENLALLQDIEQYYDPKEDYTPLLLNGFFIKTTNVKSLISYIQDTYNNSMLLLIASYLKLKYLTKSYHYFNVQVNVNIKLADITVPNYIDAHGYFNDNTIILTSIDINIPLGVKRKDCIDELHIFKSIINDLCDLICKYEFKNENLFWMSLMGLFEPDIVFDNNFSAMNSYQRIPIFLYYQNVDKIKNSTDVIIGSTSSYKCLVSKQDEYYKSAKINQDQYNKYIAPTIYRPNITFMTLGNNTFLIYWFIDTNSKSLSNLVSNIFLDSNNIYSYSEDEDYLTRVAHLLTEKLSICTQVIPVITDGIIDTTKLSCVLAFGDPISFEEASNVAKNALIRVYSKSYTSI